jgi:CubicO group peptidase (beta-lactamase class C family)
MRFAQMMLNGGELDGVHLLSPKTVELMTMNHLPSALLPMRLGPIALGGYGYGLGLGVIVSLVDAGIVGSEGMYAWSGAASTHFWIDPREELIGLILPQFMPFDQYPISREFQVLAYQAIIEQ